jgi:hypothetical protein
LGLFLSVVLIGLANLLILALYFPDLWRDCGASLCASAKLVA